MNSVFDIFSCEEVELPSEENKTQVCISCHKEKPISAFRKDNIKKNILRPRKDCIECEGKNKKVVSRIYKEKNFPPKPDCCEICGSKEKLFLDHCHTSEQFRAWLCNLCNRSVAAFGDTAEGLEKAAAILRQKEKEMHERIDRKKLNSIDFILDKETYG